MGLALKVFVGATTSQMRRGEHNNSRKSSKVPISQVDGRREEVLSQARCVTCSVRGVQHKSQD